MDIRTDNGSSVYLEVLGYQFPDKANEEWDSNWLTIYMAVTIPKGTWSVSQSFLLTYELGLIADWFDAVADHTQVENEIGFVEPDLWFEVINPTGTELYLRVHFGGDCMPPWIDRSERWAEDVFADFSLSEIDLHAAAESLRSQLRLYPQRTAH